MTENKTYRYDVFISYNHDDKSWVQNWLLPSLEKSGLRVCIDYRDFDVGVPNLDNMERAVDNSRHTLLVLSPAWVRSEWTKFEVLIAQASDPASRKRRLLPLLLMHCELPRYISMLNYADFTQEEKWNLEVKRVIEAVRGKLELSEDKLELNSIKTSPGHLHPKVHHADPLSSLQQRLIELAKFEHIPIACIGGIYLDIEIHNIEIDKDGHHCLDFTRERPIRIQSRPGGSVYYVARYLSALGRTPLIVSSIGDGGINGFANILSNRTVRDGLEKAAQGISHKPGSATAVTIHFVHPDPEKASSAMYTDRDVLKSFGWKQALKIINESSRKEEKKYNKGALYISGFFKTSLYRDLHKNLREFQQRGAVIFLDHGRLEPEQGMEERDQIRNLANALQLVDVYFSTREEIIQFIKEITRIMPECVNRPVNANDSLSDLIEKVIKDTRIRFPPIMLIKDRTGIPRNHIVGVRNINGEYSWKEIKVKGLTSYPNSEYIVGASNAFNAAFINAFLKIGDEINIESIVKCAEEGQRCLINAGAGRRIDEYFNN